MDSSSSKRRLGGSSELQDYLSYSSTPSSFGRTKPSLIYQVHVLGEVEMPGTYQVSPSMRVTDAILMAGGIKENGSRRFVKLNKQGQGANQILDLFAYYTLGEIGQNPYLQDNNVIFVGLRKNVVEIQGPVRRPGVYELRQEHTLKDLVELAGGFSVGLNQEESLKVIRYGKGKDKKVIDVTSEIAELRQFSLKEGDVVIVPHKFLSKNQFDYRLRRLPNDNIYYPGSENKVFVIGGVKSPGAFPFNQYYSLQQYLTLAGGTTVMAKKRKIHLVRVDGESIKAKDGEFKGVVNPGDTIVVPERSVPTTFYLSLLPTIASLGLSSVALFR
ncbi:MAG: SLBB domain-containing protein [Deltaproteobacteria bacterium]|nr:SLBB domain-containing protein [Deltaproteobacteria bacterium]